MLSAAVAIGAGLSAVYAYRAAEAANEQARIAKQALVAGDRPWIQTSGFTVNYANIGSNYFTVSAGVTLKNVGHSLALDVSLFTEIKANGLQYGDVTNGLASVCSRAKEAKREAVFTNIVFPGEETTLSEKEIVFVITVARIASEIGSDRDTSVYLNVCATYSGPTDSQSHGTSFGLSIAPKCRSEKERCAFNWDRPNVVPQDRLAIRVPSSGRTAE